MHVFRLPLWDLKNIFTLSFFKLKTTLRHLCLSFNSIFILFFSITNTILVYKSRFHYAIGHSSLPKLSRFVQSRCGQHFVTTLFILLFTLLTSRLLTSQSLSSYSQAALASSPVIVLSPSCLVQYRCVRHFITTSLMLLFTLHPSCLSTSPTLSSYSQATGRCSSPKLSRSTQLRTTFHYYNEPLLHSNTRPLSAPQPNAKYDQNSLQLLVFDVDI